ncbi:MULTISPECIES: hypothetical protein [Leptolyngbya]|uniref:hypothetical protein n=1 Tax=Leptolyngbya TaxID=47251 RepID=UPI0012B562D1|nr:MULTISPECIES: hypothetical protein [Leptolyngbya]MBD2371340.1 hypothetical protein [Leptolyngbya sp. FACHB-161]MBD2402281.1 hypothetical protein [Leptolyngbya sp. FACHB-239]ULP33821.1 hypothetical protein MCP04_32115 [Leptolyngbya boryana IU 594]
MPSFYRASSGQLLRRSIDGSTPTVDASTHFMFEHFPPCSLADGKADALLGWVKVVL